MNRRVWVLLLLAGFTVTTVAVTTIAKPDDWKRFRGPNGSGVSGEDSTTPVRWDDSENLKWKIELPGPGHSSPIIVGDRVFVTCWTGYGLDTREPGDQEDLKRVLVCLDRNTGKERWAKSVDAVLPEDDYRGMFAQHGYATHTPASDGENVYVHFGKSGALAYDMDGKELWRAEVGSGLGASNWGSSSSPVLYEDLVIITASAESESLIGLNRKTGEEVWRQEASGLKSTWGTPILVDVDDRTDLVLAVPGEIWGINPATGKLRWYCTSIETRSFCSSVVQHNGLVIAMESGPGGGGGIAVKAGGKGDVTDSHVVWSGNQQNRIGTPVIVDDKLFYFANKIVSCIDPKSGDEIFADRLEAPPSNETRPSDSGNNRGGRRRSGMGSSDYASPIAADGKIYFTSRKGDIYVLEVGNEFKQIAVNRVTKETEDFSATPAISNGEIFFRSSRHLYCVAEEE